jgi:hypothetical protein
MTELTGWKANTSLAEGLEQTTAWIRANPEAYPVEGYAI